jgi:hypothetical protein
MQELQGTYYGDLLDSSRINVYGWAANTFTAATQTHGTLLTGFAFLPNQYLLQQSWLRIDRPVNPASTEPDVGFRIDSIVPGTDYRFTLAKGRATYVGTARWAPPGGPASLLFSVLLTPGRYDVAEQVNMERYVDLVWSYRLGPSRTCGGEALFGWQPGVPGIGLATWYGLQGYLRQVLDARTNLVFRLEFFDDLQGQRTGFPGLYSALTTGINYSPLPALLIRPELRVDDNS